MIVIPFKAEHALSYMTLEQAQPLEKFPAYTGMVDDKVIACGGIVALWQNRAQAWMCMSPESGKYLLAIYRAVGRFFDTLPYNRIEAAVYADFLAGHRWARMLGFELECPRAEKYFPDGAAASLYAKVK
jgi:hypothetical protein